MEKNWKKYFEGLYNVDDMEDYITVIMCRFEVEVDKMGNYFGLVSNVRMRGPEKTDCSKY